MFIHDWIILLVVLSVAHQVTIIWRKPATTTLSHSWLSHYYDWQYLVSRLLVFGLFKNSVSNLGYEVLGLVVYCQDFIFKFPRDDD
jgi:hypothetical protein